MDDCWLQNLNKIDRLGLAYCRLNCWEWDNIIGPKPEGFDNLPDFDPKKGRLFHKTQKSKEDYIGPAMKAIESIIGAANVSRCWWKFVLGKTEDEWFRWFVSLGGVVY